jgi:hypothetical protein
MTQPAAEEQVRAVMTSWLAEALDLRQQVAHGFPDASAGPGALADHLRVTRAALDRVEELHGMMLAMRGNARRRAQTCQHEADDAFDSEDQAQRRNRGREDYMTGREREADVRLRIFGQLRPARQAHALASECSDVSDRLRVIYDGLRETRMDLHRLLVPAAFETHLERS